MAWCNAMWVPGSVFKITLKWCTLKGVLTYSLAYRGNKCISTKVADYKHVCCKQSLQGGNV